MSKAAGVFPAVIFLLWRYLYMSMINVTDLTFGYDGGYENVFEHASFRIDTDWRLGFTGRNGRGKTTFLNLLMGKYKYRGTISASVDFDYFPFPVENMNLFTIDVIYEHCNAEDWQIYRELSLLEVSEDVLYRPFCTLSEGERTKVMLAAMFLRENNFLLIDEPTNHLDYKARKNLCRYLCKKKGFILVSHDRALLDGCTDHTLSINRADIEVTAGNFSVWYENKERRDSYELSENERLKKDIKRLKEAEKRTSEWSDKAESRKIGINPAKTEKSLTRRPMEGRKAKKMMARSKSIQTRYENEIEEKSSLLKNIEQSAELKIGSDDFFTDKLVSLNNLSVFYGDKQVCSGVTFNVNKGDKIALTGRNGCGKSSILKLICGEDIAYTGTLIKSSRLKISYVSQSTEGLSGNLSEFAAKKGIDESLFKSILRKLDFKRSQFDLDMNEFSGGQKKKVLIAASLCEKANLFVWDEPLNFIDVISRIQLEEMLKNSNAAMIFVEHDMSFTENVATEIIEI